MNTRDLDAIRARWPEGDSLPAEALPAAQDIWALLDHLAEIEDEVKRVADAWWAEREDARKHIETLKQEVQTLRRIVRGVAKHGPVGLPLIGYLEQARRFVDANPLVCRECKKNAATYECTECGAVICERCRGFEEGSDSVVGHICPVCTHDEAVIGWAQIEP